MTTAECFAGFGGFRAAMEEVGIDTIWGCEIDSHARQAYRHFWGDELAGNDITQVDASSVPDHDILTGGFPCFVAGTMILTMAGYKPIETVRSGELVLTHLGHWRRVDKTTSRDGASIRRVQAGGIPIHTTDEHPFWVVERQKKWNNTRRVYDLSFSEPTWIDAKDLHRKHRAIQLLPIDTTDDDHTEAFWWLVGNYLAEGWIRRRYDRKTTEHGIVLACHPDDSEFVMKKVREAGFHSTLAKEGHVSKIHILSVELAAFIAQFKCGAANKCIPGWVFGIAPTKCAAIISGYMFGDGHEGPNPVGKGRLHRATTVSKALALSIVLLAQRAYNIVASVTYHVRPEKCEIDGRTVNQKPTWGISIPERNQINRMNGQHGLRFIRNNAPTGETATVYNISVEEDESYIADGVVVHNCPTFSLAGVPKLRSLNRPDGFRDTTRGTLFFDLCRILEAKRPPALVFENVKNLKSHDGGRTIGVMMNALANLDYNVRYRVFDAAHWVPQHRERTYIVGFREDLPIDPVSVLWNLDIPEVRPVDLADIMEPNPDPKYTLKDGTWAFHQRHKENSKKSGKGFGYGIIEPPFEGKITRTLSHRYHKDGAEILIAQPGMNPRMLSPMECLRLQGFPKALETRLYEVGLSDARLWMGFGNAIAVPAMAAVLRRVKLLLGGKR